MIQRHIYIYIYIYTYTYIYGLNHGSEVANMLDSDIVVSEFKLQSRSYVHFRTTILGKMYEHRYLPGMS